MGNLFHLVIDDLFGHPVYVFVARRPAAGGTTVLLRCLPNAVPDAVVGRCPRCRFRYAEFASADEAVAAGYTPVGHACVCATWDEYALPPSPAAVTVA